MTKETIALVAVGTGNAFGHGGRLYSCFHLSFGNRRILFDCGGSSLIGLRRCGLDPAEIDTVVISHLHGDHFGGIPYLLLEGKYVSRRTRPLRLIGPADLQRRVDLLGEVLYSGTFDGPLAFEVSYSILNPQEKLPLGDGAELGCVRVRHGQSPDVFGLRLDYAGRSVAYSGDSEWTDSLVELARGADLMICECLNYSSPLPSHMDYLTLMAQRQRLECQRLVLTHPGPEMLENLDKIETPLVQDGERIKI